jgi:hypothetical protein
MRHANDLGILPQFIHCGPDCQVQILKKLDDAACPNGMLGIAIADGKLYSGNQVFLLFSSQSLILAS